MPVAPLWRFGLLSTWLAAIDDVMIAATTDAYDPADDTIGDVTVVGDPLVLPSPAIVDVSGQAWLTIDDDPPLAITGIPAASEVTGLWVYGAGGSGPFVSMLVAFLDRRADSTPIAFTADGGSYDLSFPGGFVVRL